MRTDFFCCCGDETAATARALMERHHCRHLIVADRDRNLIGILSKDDLPPGAEPAAKPSDAACSSDARMVPNRRSGSGKRSEEHTSELQSLMRISYAVFCLKKKNTIQTHTK